MKRARLFQVFSQDAFCFPGCMPEGDGCNSNGDTFDTREDAIADALGLLERIFESELRVNSDSATVRAVFNECARELLSRGETSCELPYRDEDGAEEVNEDGISTHGFRFISIEVVNVED